MANDNKKNAQNYIEQMQAQVQAQFEQAQKAFQSNAQSVDANKAAQTFQAIAEKTAESYTAATKAWFDSAQSIAKSQAEFYQKQAEQISAAASKAMNASKPEDNIESSAKLAQKSVDANLKNSQEVAKSASETAVQVFDILNKQAVENLNEISKVSKAS